MQTETPFTKFWSALNEQCRINGYPEPTFGPAKRAWDKAVLEAGWETFQTKLKDAA